jgi:hypothetical protein
MATDSVFLPVSLGEAIDKLTILDIKRDNIKDERRKDVELEYNLLLERLGAHVEQHGGLYNSMKKVNRLIWDYMDLLRDGCMDDQAYLALCRKTVEYNDIRFRIKNKINYAAQSVLKEQKGYKINSVLIEICGGLDTNNFVAPIRYYSFLYDQVVIQCDEHCGLRDVFKDDPTILFLTGLESESAQFKGCFSFPESHYSAEEILAIFRVDQKGLEELL